MAGNLRWDGDAARKRVLAEVGKRLDAARFVVMNHARELIGKEGAGKAAGGKGGLAYGANPSAPGDPPHKQTGRLQGSVASERDGLVARVGTNVKYGRWLELGTGRMAPRPWLRRALLESAAAVRAILSRPIT